MTPDQFFITYRDQSLLYNTTDPSLRGQCVQGACVFAKANGFPIVWKDAAQWWYSNPAGYAKVSPGAMQPGDLVIWDTTLPGSSGAGHIAVFYYWITPGQMFMSVDQNWGGNKTIHTVQHDMRYVLGGLRGLPVGKGADTPQQTTPQGVQQMIIQNAPNWYARCDKTMQLIRGRSIGQEEFTKYAVGAEFLHWVESVEDNPEADQAYQWQRVGKQALTGPVTWPDQIYGLEAQVKQYQADLANALKNQQLSAQQRDTLQAKYDAAEQQLNSISINNKAATENNTILARIASFLHVPGY